MQQSHTNKERVFFLFVNEGSGGGIGNQLLSHQFQTLGFYVSRQSKFVTIHIYGMKKNRQKGFKHLKHLTDNKQSVGVAICGGDGTVMWVVSEFSKYNIDPSATPICIIPVGTGNDFSQEFGWGQTVKSLTLNCFQPLKLLAEDWLNAKQQLLDLWDVQVQTYQNGFFEQYKKSEQRHIKLAQQKIQRTFCNYFSFGMDGKIGYSFDIHRKNSRLANLATYGIMGAIKNLSKTKTVQTLLESMEIKQQLSDTIPKQSSIVLSQNQQQSKIKKIQSNPENPSLIFRTSQSFTSEKASTSIDPYQLQGDYCNLVALNITSFMGGVKNIWQNAANNKKEDFQPQNISDGKLQFVGFSSGLGMGLERLIKGRAEKVTQGSGPYYLKFKKSEQTKYRTYIQIDGQFFRFNHPKSITIKHSDIVPRGMIKVLRRQQFIK